MHGRTRGHVRAGNRGRVAAPRCDTPRVLPNTVLASDSSTTLTSVSRPVGVVADGQDGPRGHRARRSRPSGNGAVATVRSPRWHDHVVRSIHRVRVVSRYDPVGSGRPAIGQIWPSGRPNIAPARPPAAVAPSTFSHGNAVGVLGGRVLWPARSISAVMRCLYCSDRHRCRSLPAMHAWRKSSLTISRTSDLLCIPLSEKGIPAAHATMLGARPPQLTGELVRGVFVRVDSARAWRPGSLDSADEAHPPLFWSGVDRTTG